MKSNACPILSHPEVQALATLPPGLHVLRPGLPVLVTRGQSEQSELAAELLGAGGRLDLDHELTACWAAGFAWPCDRPHTRAMTLGHALGRAKGVDRTALHCLLSDGDGVVVEAHDGEGKIAAWGVESMARPDKVSKK